MNRESGYRYITERTENKVVDILPNSTKGQVIDILPK